MRRLAPVALIATALVAIAPPAAAHVAGAHVHAGGFASGLAHPLGGLDHLLAMVAVGLLAARRGGRALWLFPATFVGVMMVGAALGAGNVGLPLVEPGIAASVLVLGALLAWAGRLPEGIGAALCAAFAVFHGHAHGTELAEGAGLLPYMLGFGIATAALHGLGIGLGLGAAQALARREEIAVGMLRTTGAAMAVVGSLMMTGAI